MTEIKTLVYFDIEATGLKSSGKPRITEISLVAVNLASVLELHEVIAKLKTEDKLDRSSIGQLSPRVVNKLSLCFYPMTIIMPGVTALTGLDNYNLSGQSVFDADTAKMMESFLGRLPAPACLVAHNGDKYDYPLIMAELSRAGGSSIDVLCVDTYTGIRQIFQQREERIKMKIAEEEMTAVSNLLDEGKFDDDFSVTQNGSVINDLTDNKRKPEQEDSNMSHEVFKKSRIMITENETTPVRKAPDNPKTEQDRIIKAKSSQTTIGDFYKSRKRLDFSAGQSFSLINLHTSLLGHPPDQSHGAEADCFALLRVTAALGHEWTDWMGNNVKKLNSIKPMWNGNKKSTNECI